MASNLTGQHGGTPATQRVADGIEKVNFFVAPQVLFPTVFLVSTDLCPFLFADPTSTPLRSGSSHSHTILDMSYRFMPCLRSF